MQEDNTGHVESIRPSREPLDGQGGMGLVLQAWDEVLHRTVALKFLAPQCRPALASRLRAEARAVARLDHENIVRILDLSEWCGAFAEEGLPFLVMEYLEGESLASLLRGGPLVPAWRHYESRWKRWRGHSTPGVRHPQASPSTGR